MIWDERDAACTPLIRFRRMLDVKRRRKEQQHLLFFSFGVNPAAHLLSAGSSETARFSLINRNSDELKSARMSVAAALC